MIAAMVNFDDQKQTILVIVIEPDNFERMKEADPVTLESTTEGGWLQPPQFPFNFSILFGYETNQEELHSKAKTLNPAEFIKWLERGRKFIPGVDGVQHVHRIKRSGDGTSN